MPVPEGFKDLHFPLGGLNVVCPFGNQPNVPIVPNSNIYARTTPVGVNVQPFEVAQLRVRGGSRCGLSKLIDEQVNDALWVVQHLNTYAVIGANPNSQLLQNLIGYYALDGNLLDTSGHNQNLLADGTVASPAYGTGIINQDLTNGAGYVKPLALVTDNGFSLSAWFYATNNTGDGAGTGFGKGSETGTGYRIVYNANGTNGQIVLRDRTGSARISSGLTLTFGTWHHAVVTYVGSVSGGAGLATLYVDGASVGTYSLTLTGGWSSKLTYGINTIGTNFTSPIDEVAVWSVPITAADVLDLYNSGSGLNPVVAGMELSQSGRVVYLVTVSQGVVATTQPGENNTWSYPTNNTGESPPLNYTGLVYSAANNQMLFFVDGINYIYLDPTTNSLELWSAAIDGGTLPQDANNNYARLICTWRGRTVLSGILDDPQNWFMSAVSDPFNFDYSPPLPSPAQAVAGNNSTLGLVGEPVMALIPYSDDILICGCTDSIWMFRGDPMAGGQIDRVSDEIGMAWATGWCKDPYGNVYFVSNRCGIYSMQPGQLPVRISQSIEPLLADLDMGRNIFHMQWDDRFQGFHLWITWVDEPQVTTHFFYESRTNAWFEVVYGNTNLNPLCSCTFDGNTPVDRVVLMGCWDGYVRQVDPTSTTDDGTPIQSEVWIGPLLTPDFDDILLKDLQGVLGESSGDLNYEVYVGTTAEKALSSTPISSGTLGPGRNATDLVRYSGHAIYVALSSSNQWAMEAIRVRIQSKGRVRRREVK